MSERRIGLIPSAVMVNQQECAVFVSDQRIIVIPSEAPSSKGLREQLKASLGPQADLALAPRPKTDYATVDIESLAKSPENESYQHMAIEKLKVGKGIGGYGIWGTYTAENLKKEYLVLAFIPPKQLVQKRRAEGVSGREALRMYALRCQEVFRKALPPIISEKVDWKI